MQTQTKKWTRINPSVSSLFHNPHFNCAEFDKIKSQAGLPFLALRERSVGILGNETAKQNRSCAEGRDGTRDSVLAQNAKARRRR